MKKFVSLSLALILIFSVGATLTACDEHTCEFKEEWASNATHHWHECKGDNCLQTQGNAEHEWDEGTANEETATETEMKMTYTCKVCGATKGENVQLEGAVEEEEWEAAVAEQKFDNVTIHYTFISEDQGTQNHVVKITENKVYRSVKTPLPDGDTNNFETTFEGEEAKNQREMFLTMFLSLLAEKENFKYDPEEKAYIMPKEVQTKLSDPEDESRYVMETMRNGRVVFDAKGNVTSFTFWVNEASYRNDKLIDEVSGDITVQFSDYGTTVVD
jgi:hypothetical protein